MKDFLGRKEQKKTVSVLGRQDQKDRPRKSCSVREAKIIIVREMM